MVEEYVKDLHRIGLILVIVPLVFTIIYSIAALVFSNGHIDFSAQDFVTLSCLVISGSSIVGYIESKYHYKPFEKISIPVWPILLLIAVGIVLYLWWRLSLI